MPDLPEVQQKFEADVAPYIAAMKEAADAAMAFARANGIALTSVKALQEAMGTMAEAAVAQAAVARTAIAGIGDQLTSLAAKSAAAGAAGNAGAALFLNGWRLTANTIHWIISGTIEFLAVALPAAIAAAVGAFVLYQGVVEDVARRMNALYTATEATSNMLHRTAGDALGLGHAFQTAQDAANPIAYQLLGNYINIARAHMVNFASAGLAVAHAVGELGARIQVDLLEHGAALNGLLANMVPDLIEFGQILGNIGHALLNFAADMPGLAELLLKIADGISRVILWLSELPRWVILGAAALEEFTRWGGLLVGIFGKLGFATLGLEGKFFSLTRVASVIKGVFSILPAIIGAIGRGIIAVAPEFGALASDVQDAGYALKDFGDGSTEAIKGLSIGATLGLAAIAAGMGFLIYKAVTAKDAVQQFGDALENKITGASNVQALGVITQSIGAMNQKLAETPRYVEADAHAWAGMKLPNAQLGEFTQYQKQMIGQFGNVAAGADTISKAYGVNFSGALALADQAGVKLATTEVKLGRNANIAGAQIEGLVQGYAKLNQRGGILSNDMNALAIQAGLAGTKVSQLNQAWDQFLQNSTSLTSSLATLNQDLTQVGNVGVSVGGAFRVFEGQAKISVDAVAQSLNSFSGKSAQTWQNYDAALQQAGQFTDSLRTASAYGAISQRNYTGAIADSVLALLPFASKSKTALEELSGLAQQAGGPATDNFKTLKDWVDKNKISTDELDKAIQIATGDMSDAGKAAAEFASTLQSQMQTDLANALLSQSNLNKAVGNFQQAVLKSGGQISSSSPQYKELYSLLRAAGESASQARAEMRLLQNTIDGLHGKQINIGVTTTYQQVGQPSRPGQTGVGVSGGQHGGVVSGPSGIDHVPAWLTAGEAVLTARAVAAMGGPMAIHQLNTSPQAVLSAGTGGGGGTAMHLSITVPVELDGSKIATAHRTETLIYSRRNPSNNLNLRVR